MVVVAVAGPALELRDFATGSDGKGPVGGAIEGRDGRGSEFADMLMALGAFVRVLPQLGELLAMHGWPDRPFAFSNSLRHYVHVPWPATGRDQNSNRACGERAAAAVLLDVLVAASVSDSTWADRDLGAGADASVAAAARCSGYCRLTSAHAVRMQVQMQMQTQMGGRGSVERVKFGERGRGDGHGHKRRVSVLGEKSQDGVGGEKRSGDGSGYGYDYGSGSG